ncbi:TTAGGG repeat binding factor [Coniosporium tulheliwenetii]|uniref:TTAGGG repeat binding factor n=1 Tax=Coniosporium tulheliwenetii TaxID=3383036 RepID=A0ACC2ZKE1_9PEZI|nr:TTAGGG repeat binding factor [Cladosporium sp. JES 115]
MASDRSNWERHQPYSGVPEPSNDRRKHLFAGKHRRKISEIPEEDFNKRLKRNANPHSGQATDAAAVDDLSSGLVQHDPFEQSRGPGPPVFSMGGHQEPVRLNTNSNPGNYLSIYSPLNEASSTDSTDPYGADWPPVISRPSKAPINSSQDFHPYQPFPFNQEYAQFNEQAYSGNQLVQGAIEAVPVAMQYLPSGYETASDAFVGQDINPALSETSALSLSHGAVGQDVELDSSLDWKIQSLPILDNLDMIDEFFPDNLELSLLMRRPAPNQQISPSEQDFLQRVKTRRSYLLSEPDTPEAVAQLLKKYEWKDFLKEIINCAGRYVESSTSSVQTDDSNAERQSPTSSNNYPAPEEVAPSASYGGPYYYAPQLSAATLRTEQSPGSLVTPAALAVSVAFEGSASPDPSSSQSAPQYLQMAPPTPHQYPPLINATPALARSPSLTPKPPSQKHKPTIPTTRRLWTSEEESALLDGLERVGGPHWSQILGLYGAGGIISEVLKGRNQIQLKDKARNLKLFFLKSGSELPYYLQGVTGELRTRAPTQAARQEALARAREMEMEGREK